MPEDLQPAIDALDEAICRAARCIARAQTGEHPSDLDLAAMTIETASAALADLLTALETFLA